MKDVPQALVEAVGDRVDPDVEGWWIRDLTDSYPWIETANIFWVIGEEHGSAMIAEDAPGRFRVLSDPDGLDLIARLLGDNLGAEPVATLGPEAFCKVIVEWYQDPRGYLAIPSFVTDQAVVLDTWLMGSETSPEALIGTCQDIVIDRPPDGPMTLSFSVFTHDGGVDRWSVVAQETPFRLDAVRIEPVAPEGTFSYPDEF